MNLVKSNAMKLIVQNGILERGSNWHILNVFNGEAQSIKSKSVKRSLISINDL
jgi:hypothetical protein